MRSLGLGLRASEASPAKIPGERLGFRYGYGSQKVHERDAFQVENLTHFAGIDPFMRHWGGCRGTRGIFLFLLRALTPSAFASFVAVLSARQRSARRLPFSVARIVVAGLISATRLDGRLDAGRLASARLIVRRRSAGRTAALATGRGTAGRVANLKQSGSPISPASNSGQAARISLTRTQLSAESHTRDTRAVPSRSKRLTTGRPGSGQLL
jgi:hypothetical protein